MLTILSVLHPDIYATVCEYDSSRQNADRILDEYGRLLVAYAADFLAGDFADFEILNEAHRVALLKARKEVGLDPA